MSVSHTDIDVALPHASLLAYFRNPAAALEAKDHGTPPSEDSSSADARQLLHPRTHDDDDESKYGFWGELDGANSSSEADSSYNKGSVMRGAATFCCLWCAFSVIILGAFGLYFAVDLVFSHYGLGTGMAEWIMYRHQLPPSTSYEMKFCLDSPDREAPCPQVWRYMIADTNDRCMTDTIDFILNSKETWKVQPGASLLLGNEKPHLDQFEQTRELIVSQEQVQAP